MPVVTYQAASYAPEKVVKRYVARRINSSFYKLFEANADSYTLREIDQVRGVDLPVAIANKADDLRGHWPNQVELAWTNAEVEKLLASVRAK